MSTHVGIEDSLHAEIEHMRAILLGDRKADPALFDRTSRKMLSYTIGERQPGMIPDHDYVVGVIATLTILLEDGII